jgi:hypothetical protein
MGRVKLLAALALAAAFAGDSAAGAFEDIPYEPVISGNPAFLRGITYFPREEPLSALPNQAKNLDLMLATGVEWVALVPVWYQQTRTSTLIAPAKGKTAPDESVREVIRYLHAKGAKVMLKPYVNSHDGVWRANFEPKNVDAWFNSYRRFINHYADMGASEDVEMLCVGVEYKWCDQDQYEQWSDTVDAVRSRYDGELTYAAHWRGYDKVCLWDLVDHVGVDAYYRVVKGEDASLSALVKGWREPLDDIENWLYGARFTDKEVIFTEVGYQSRPACWMNPGKTARDKTDLRAQEICYKALFMAAPARRWLRGIFIWCWDNWSPDAGGGPDNNNWTPKHKPAEKVLSDYYHSY